MDASPGCPPEVSLPSLHEHSNSHLLKIDTNDKYSTVGALKKFIAKELSLSPGQQENPPAPLFPGMVRINKNPKTPFVFLAFATESDRQAASTALQSISFRGERWREIPVTDRDLSVTHKGTKKRARGDDDGSKLTQYEHFSMGEQIERKKKHCLGVMKCILPSKVYGWDAYSNRFMGIVESPNTVGYRNHVNLSFGFSDAGVPTLGFQKGSLMEGTAAIESAVDPERTVVTMGPEAKVVAMLMMNICCEFAAEENGGLSVFNKVTVSGFWRKLQIRNNVRGEVMIDLEVDADSCPKTVMDRVEERLVASCSSAELKGDLQRASGKDSAAVVSLQYHKHTGIGSLPLDAPRIVLLGGPTLTEYLFDFKFELSPTAFFQVNTAGMERMLDRVKEVAELTSETTLLDLCSGTGTIGLSLSKYVKRVIGIEIVESAVQDARRNAVVNQIANAEFHCGRVEQLLPTVINSLMREGDGKHDIVAILDPPRAGVNSQVLKWIRGTPGIRRVIYISCEQKALERDCPALTKPSTKAYRGTPFEVMAAFAVDLFPHTHHVEMVAVLERKEEVTEEVADESSTPPPPPVAE